MKKIIFSILFLLTITAYSQTGRRCLAVRDSAYVCDWNSRVADTIAGYKDTISNKKWNEVKKCQYTFNNKKYWLYACYLDDENLNDKAQERMKHLIDEIIALGYIFYDIDLTEEKWTLVNF